MCATTSGGSTSPSPPPLSLGHSINVPGKLLVAEGNDLITQDYLWGASIIESSLNKLELHKGKAFLRGAPYRFVDQQVEQVVLDGAGHALVSHSKAYYTTYGNHSYNWEDYDRSRSLSMLDMKSKDLSLLSETEIDDWASLKDARQGRALYQIPGGLLVVNLDDPKAPYAQSYFPTKGWPRDMTISGDSIYFSAGAYGLYTFGLDETNLRQFAPEDLAE